jgi:ATP-dependent Lon protease
MAHRLIVQGMKSVPQVDISRKWFPIVPTKNIMLFPGTEIPMIISTDRSVNAIRFAADRDQNLIFINQKNVDVVRPDLKDLRTLGILCKVHLPRELADGSMRMFVEGISKVRITNSGPTFDSEVNSTTIENDFLRAQAEKVEEIFDCHSSADLDLWDQFTKMIKSFARMDSERMDSYLSSQTWIEKSLAIDVCLNSIKLPVHVLIELFEIIDFKKKLEKAVSILNQLKDDGNPAELLEMQDFQSKLDRAAAALDEEENRDLL